jgi:hypothetical protein
MKKKTKIVKPVFCWLEITSFGACLGAEHFYGKLRMEDMRYQEVRYKLSAKQAKALNKKDSYATYKAGYLSDRYWSKVELIADAMKQWRDAFPEADVLIRGSCGTASIQQWLAVKPGLEEMKNAVNNLFARYEKVGGYDGDEEAANAIDKRYWALTGQHWT